MQKMYPGLLQGVAAVGEPRKWDWKTLSPLQWQQSPQLISGGTLRMEGDSSDDPYGAKGTRLCIPTSTYH